MSPKQVSAGIPCCSARETTIRTNEGFTLQSQVGLSNCICVKLLESYAGNEGLRP